jgi:hypothetical protein
MNAYDRDRLGEFLQFLQEVRAKLDPDNPWSHAFGEFEGQLTRTLGRHLAPGRPEPVMLSKKVSKLLTLGLCLDAEAIGAGYGETTERLFEGLAKLGQHMAFVREVELGVVSEVDHVRMLLPAIADTTESVGRDMAGAVLRGEPEEQKERRKLEKSLRRLNRARKDCKRFLDEAEEMAAERVTVDA